VVENGGWYQVSEFDKSITRAMMRDQVKQTKVQLSG